MPRPLVLPKPTARSWSKDWMRPGCCAKKGSRVYALDAVGYQMQRLVNTAANWPTKPVGTVHISPSLTAGTPRRKPATPAGGFSTSAGRSTGHATSAMGAAGQSINATTTPRSTSRATRYPPRVIAPSAQSGPPSSVEPTIRPGLAGQVAVKRGSDPAPGPGNNPEKGCQPDE